MGSYAATTDLIARFASSIEAAYATDAEASGTPSEDVLGECINTAEGEINSYLSVRYATPVDVSVDTELADLLLGVTLDIAEYHVLNRGPEIGEQKIAQYERRIAWLKLFAEGGVSLPGAVELPGAATVSSTAFWSGSNRELPDDGPRISSRVTMEGL